jgi:hypothetical protein
VGDTAVSQDSRDRVQDRHGLGHPSGAGLAAGHVTSVRPDEADAVGLEGRHVAAGRGMGPHHRVHGGCGEHGLVGGEQGGRGEVVGMAVRHLGQKVGRGRGHDHEIGLAGQPDMAHFGLVGERKEVGVDLLLGEAGDRERGDELAAGASQNHPKGEAPLAAPPDKLEHLVGRDAAADDEENSSQAPSPLGARCRG